MDRGARVLICRPTHFRVAYEINPWMNLRRQPAPALAVSQWQNLKALLQTLADPLEIESQPDTPDMVFTANAGFVHQGRVIVSRFRHPQRRVEEPCFRRWFEHAGFEPVDWPPDLCFEGEGDALHHPGGGCIWFGYGIRSELAAAARLRRVFATDVVPLRLVSPSFYHLDTCFCPLPGGAVMYYPAALSAESRLLLYRLVPAALRIEVDAEDAHAFACNAVSIGSTVILNTASPRLCEALGRLGLSVRQCTVDQFMLSGGAVKCLTLGLG